MKLIRLGITRLRNGDVYVRLYRGQECLAAQYAHTTEAAIAELRLFWRIARGSK